MSAGRHITRRDAILGASSTLLLPLACSRGSAPPRDDVFRHGVASGDPDETSVVIWSRASGFGTPVEVGWQLATDPDFADISAEGTVLTGAERDYTVKAVVAGLQPGVEYFYRFAVVGAESPVGRTRTLPTGRVERLVLAVASCSNHPFGYFNAYQVIADDPDVDLVVHLGDYIYEYDKDSYGGETGKRIGRIHDPPHECVTLDDYRRRLAQYHTDAGSIAMHARHPLIAIWDDHESANNPWMRGAENHQPGEGDWAARREASLRAYYEWMPVRDPDRGADRAAFWRHFRFGDLASLVTLESRHTGRSLQIASANYELHSAADREKAAFERDVIGAPERNMLAPAMEQFLASSLDESVRSGRPWRIIGNQTVMALRRAPPLDEAFFHELRQRLDESGRAMLDRLTRLGRRDLLVDLDSWNGYPAARERFYRTASDAGASDLLVLAGDSHSYWQNQLFAADGQRMGVELGTTGITSPRSLLSLGPEGLARFDELNAEHNDEVVWTEGRYRGFIRLELGRERAKADYVIVTNIESRDYDVRVIRSVEIEKQGQSLVYA